MPPYLAVGGDRQSRSKSPGGRERSRSRSNVRDERESERRGSSQRKPSKQLSESESESSEEEDPRYRNRRSSKQLYDPPSDDDYRRGRGKPATPKSSTKSLPAYAPVPPPAAQYAQPTAQARPQPPGAFHQDMPVRHVSYTGHDPRYAPPPANSFIQPQPEPRQRAASNAGPQYANVGEFKYAQVDPTMAYKYNDRPQVSQPETRSKPQYVDVHPDQFEPKSRDKKYNDDKYEIRDRDSGRKERKMYDDDYSNYKKYREDKYEKRESIVEPEEKSRRPSRLSMSGGAGLGAGLGAATLGVAGHAMNSHGGKPPASPLLEAYKGTYQSISPMPSALVLAAHPDDSDLSDFGGLESDSDSDISDSDPNAKLKRKIRMLEKEKEMNRHDPRGRDHGEIVNPKGHQPGRHKAMIEIGERDHREVIEYDRHRPGGPGRAMVETREPDDEIDVMRVTVGKHGPVRSPIGPKKVKFYEPANDAKEIAAALKGTHRAANVKPLIKILPGLTVNEMDALKTEYKKHAKHDGVGINMSRHIKLRIPGYVGKAAYACSLGQWESESFWANCYYQTGASRRELLIESLMGRTNQQIREIKNFFKDKKYDDDLEKCMKTELKADKFRVAILLALQEERMSESAPLQGRLVRQDVQDLHEALTSAGGETAMISIIVIRSDAHLREVLREYERLYGRNFARDMISKSKNLVGETLAHILNGALNRPMRDALLLHQAIAETAPGKERAELLISRLIRLHWEPKHFEKVKEQYAKRYGVKVNEAIKKEIQKGMKTEEGIAWTNFCIELVKSSEA